MGIEQREPAPRTIKMFAEMNTKVDTLLTKVIDTGLLGRDIEYIKSEISEIKQYLKDDYITRKEYNADIGLLRTIVLGAAGIILVSVWGYLISLVIRQ